MRPAGLLLTLVVVLGVGYYFYSRALVPVTPGGVAPLQEIQLTAVQSDLLAIAQAERNYLARNDRYATLAELISSGDLSPSRTGRGGYRYTVLLEGGSFTATARYQGSEPGTHPVLRIDETLRVKRE